MIGKTLVAMILVVLAANANAAVKAESEIAVTANLMAASCAAARANLPQNDALKIAYNSIKVLPSDRIEHAVPVVAFVSFWGVVAVLASMVG